MTSVQIIFCLLLFCTCKFTFANAEQSQFKEKVHEKGDISAHVALLLDKLPQRRVNANLVRALATYSSELLFYRSGWPKETFDLEPGATAVLSCHQIGFTGDAKKAPATAIRWFKDGKLIRSSKKKKISGKKKKPLIEGTRLSLTQLKETDAGIYTCKLALKKDTIQHYLLSMNFTVNIKKAQSDVQKKFAKKYAFQITDTITTANFASALAAQNQKSPAPEKISTTIIVVSAVASLVAFAILSIYLCKKISLKPCRKKQEKSRQNANELSAIACQSVRSSLKKTAEIEDDKRVSPLLDSTLPKFSQEANEEPKYVNTKRYRDYFPFVKDMEWKLLEQNHINRNRVRCQVEHAMPVILGTGNFGQVYQAEVMLEDETARNVAVKRLNDGCKIDDLGDFLKEAITLLKAGYHPNIISLIGCVLLDSLEDLGIEHETKKPPILLMEVAREGNLKTFLQCRRFSESEKRSLPHGLSGHVMDKIRSDEQLRQNSVVGRNLNLKHLTSFVYQAAKGMQHLANKKIVHRDLAARNVLLTSDFVVKIADFGLSKHMKELQQEYYRINNFSITPAKWTAPESLSENVFSVKSDVWSFGILTWEVYTLGEDPYLGIPTTQLYRHLAKGNQLEKPSYASDSVYKIMQQCWNWHAKDRPNFNELVDFFDQTLLSVSEPYMELHGRQDSFASSQFLSEDDSLTQHGTSIVHDYNDKSSAKSCDSGRSSDSVFTFSSSSALVGDHVIDDFVATTLERKISDINELINHGYGLPD